MESSAFINSIEGSVSFGGSQKGRWREGIVIRTILIVSLNNKNKRESGIQLI